MPKKFVLNHAGVGHLLKSAEMQAVLKQHATEIMSRVGDGYEQDTFVGRNRANAMVTATSSKALKDNLDNNTLLKAVHS